MTKFRVLAGSHREGGITYRQGDIVDSKSNLLKHNRGGRKYARVTDEEAFQDPVDEAAVATAETVTAADDGLEAMSEDELREFADSNGIKLTGKEKAKQLVAKIREAME